MVLVPSCPWADHEQAISTSILLLLLSYVCALYANQDETLSVDVKETAGVKKVENGEVEASLDAPTNIPWHAQSGVYESRFLGRRWIYRPRLD